uniref:RING finger protein 141 n=1 Tax=Electrophorus electricus TaxID=8005 RepID=A0AAY5ECI9_ELEEL
MGQQISGQAVMSKLPEKLIKHAGLVRDSGYLTYDEFLAAIAKRNFTRARVSDMTARVKLRVSLQINKEDGMVEASRIMNLYQFIQLYKDITSQAAEVLAGEGSAEHALGQPPTADSCRASMWMCRVKQLTDEEECCICMDGKADLILPCAHSFCQKCIDKWSGQSRNCPICRIQVTAANESWVMSDAPTEEDMASYILNLADEAGHPHRP